MVTLFIEDNIDGCGFNLATFLPSTENTSNVIVEIENNADNQIVLQDIKKNSYLDKQLKSFSLI